MHFYIFLVHGSTTKKKDCFTYLESVRLFEIVCSWDLYNVITPERVGSVNINNAAIIVCTGSQQNTGFAWLQKYSET